MTFYFCLIQSPMMEILNESAAPLDELKNPSETEGLSPNDKSHVLAVEGFERHML
jgi:hypothetical protein